MNTLNESLTDYCEARGIDVPRDRTVKHLAGEVAELGEALTLLTCNVGTRFEAWYEIADVALCLATIARTVGVEIEDCIDSKIEHDRGRGL